MYLPRGEGEKRSAQIEFQSVMPNVDGQKLGCLFCFLTSGLLISFITFDRKDVLNLEGSYIGQAG